MAHVQKNTKAQSKGLSRHCNDKGARDRQDHIDHERTHENYNLMERDQSPEAYLQERMEQLYHIERADLKVTADWVITLPQGWQGDSREFFTCCTDFLNDRYGSENCIFATVHKDEARDHMHYCFIPVAPDKNPKHEQDHKICAKEVLNKQELRDFHKDLQEHLRERLPERGEREIQVYGIEKERVKDRSLREFKAFKEEQRIDRLEKQQKEREISLKSKERDLEHKTKDYDRYNKEVDRYTEEHGLTEAQYQREVYLNQKNGYYPPEPEKFNPERTAKERAEIERAYSEYSHNHERDHERDS